METLLGYGNTLFDYILVLLTYSGLFIIMRYANKRIEPGFKKSFMVLYWGWSAGVFIGNYLCYLIGVMSFLPWLNNFIHTFIWIGFCLTFLYAGCYKNPLWEQFLLFAIFSFIVKIAERLILGTWEHSHFFFINGNAAYIIGWSLMDGLYPFISMAGLKLISKHSKGILVPS